MSGMIQNLCCCEMLVVLVVKNSILSIEDESDQELRPFETCKKDF